MRRWIARVLWRILRWLEPPEPPEPCRAIWIKLVGSELDGRFYHVPLTTEVFKVPVLVTNPKLYAGGDPAYWAKDVLHPSFGELVFRRSEPVVFDLVSDPRDEGGAG